MHSYRHASGIGIICVHSESLGASPLTPHTKMIFIPHSKNLSYNILQLINSAGRNFAEGMFGVGKSFQPLNVPQISQMAR